MNGHSTNCERAGGKVCVCGCMTTQHGEEHLRRARSMVRVPNPSENAELEEQNRKADEARDAEVGKAENARSDVDRGMVAFRAARQRKPKKGKRRPNKPPSTVLNKLHTVAVSSIVVYLGEHPNELNQVSKIAVALGKPVATALSEALAEDDEYKARNGSPGGLGLNHLWCSVLAAVAQGMDEFKALTVSFRDYVIDTVVATPVKTGATSATWFTGMRRHFVTLLVTSAWGALQNALEISSGWRAFLKAVRILAIIVCPDMDRHPDVLKFCAIPLMQELLAEDAFDWFQSTAHDAYPKLFVFATSEQR